jgi:hypothetical protein
MSEELALLREQHEAMADMMMFRRHSLSAETQWWGGKKMSRPITKNQLADFWLAEYAPNHNCCLCGNSGVIDTRGKVFTAAGVECGAKVYCICPNGRQIAKPSALTRTWR